MAETNSTSASTDVSYKDENQERRSNRVLLCGFILLALVVIGGIVAVVVIQTLPKKDATNGQSGASKNNINAAISFQLPSTCTRKTKPQIKYSNHTDASIEQIKSLARRIASDEPWGYGFAVIVHYDPSTQKYSTAIQKRSDGNLGIPGGEINDNGETVRDGTLREVKEEAMHGTGVKPADMILMQVSTINKKKGGTTRKNPGPSALYILFVNDTRAVTGPDQYNEKEVSEDASLDIKKPTYHKFFELDLSQDSSNGKILADPKIDSHPKFPTYWKKNVRIAHAWIKNNCKKPSVRRLLSHKNSA